MASVYYNRKPKKEDMPETIKTTENTFSFEVYNLLELKHKIELLQEKITFLESRLQMLEKADSGGDGMEKMMGMLQMLSQMKGG